MIAKCVINAKGAIGGWCGVAGAVENDFVVLALKDGNIFKFSSAIFMKIISIFYIERSLRPSAKIIFFFS